MKTIILVLGLLAVFGLLVCFRQFRVEKPPPIAVSSAGPTIERLERLSISSPAACRLQMSSLARETAAAGPG